MPYFPAADPNEFVILVIGPLVLGPLSEVFGRARVLQAANLWYLGIAPHLSHVFCYFISLVCFYIVWNFGCAWAQNTGEMLAFRLMSGFGGSGCLSVSRLP